MKKRLLIVDDDASTLNAIQRLLRHKKNIWELDTAPSVDEALAMFKKNPYDVIISDVKMPKRDGLDLLNEIKINHQATH